MAAAKYRTREYRAARASITAAQARGEWLVCVQPDLLGVLGAGCVRDTRDIAPHEMAHVAHDATGTVILGAAHELCNERDGGVRRHLVREPRRWIL